MPKARTPRLSRFEGPLSGVVGPSRRAAWRRRVLRRALAALLLALAIAVLVQRPGILTPRENGSANGVPRAVPTDGVTSPGSLPGESLAPPQRGDTRAPGDSGSGAVGARSVPVGTVGVALPLIDPGMALRLRPGDLVDVYAPAGRGPVARRARVIDVKQPSTGPGDAFEMDGEPPSSTVFVALDPGDVARVTAGAGPEASSWGYWLAVHPASDAAAPGVG